MCPNRTFAPNARRPKWTFAGLRTQARLRQTRDCWHDLCSTYSRKSGSDRLFGFLTLDVIDEQNPLLNHAAAERVSSSLPLDNPTKTLQALCKALATLADRPDPDIDQLGVLLSLDRRTARLREQLLNNSVKRDLRSWPPENTIWQSVLEAAIRRSRSRRCSCPSVSSSLAVV